jgi:hypothetical protein
MNGAARVAHGTIEATRDETARLHSATWRKGGACAPAGTRAALFDTVAGISSNEGRAAQAGIAFVTACNPFPQLRPGREHAPGFFLALRLLFRAHGMNTGRGSFSWLRENVCPDVGMRPVPLTDPCGTPVGCTAAVCASVLAVESAPRARAVAVRCTSRSRHPIDAISPPSAKSQRVRAGTPRCTRAGSRGKTHAIPPTEAWHGPCDRPPRGADVGRTR